MGPDQLLQQEQAEAKCHADIISKPYPDDGKLYCGATWDKWGCWEYTLAGQRAFTKCPSFQTGFDPRLSAFKDCTKDGTWWRNHFNVSWANYSTCVDPSQLERDRWVVKVFIIGYSMSIAFLLVSLFIFFFYRQLQCDRITIHKNLFISYVLNSVTWILVFVLAAMDANVLKVNPLWCQVLHVFAQYFTTCNFFWMFCEGLYLHTLIVVAFTTGKKLLVCCICIAWGIPILTTTAYTIARASIPGGQAECWFPENRLTWILFAPILLTFLGNFIFICNIIRVLISKMRACNAPADNHQMKKAVRAIIILIPLLGLQFILFPFRPEQSSGFLWAYEMLSAAATSSQGFFVSLIFCFLNGDVTVLLRRKWNQQRLMSTGGRLGANSTTESTTQNRTRMSEPKNSPRRIAFPFKDKHRPLSKGNGKATNDREQELPLKTHCSTEESTMFV